MGVYPLGKDTPPSGKRIPDGPDSPTGIKRSRFPDKESPNVAETFDSDDEVFPLKEVDYLPGAQGLD